MRELMEINAIATSGQYREHVDFWKKALNSTEGEFRFTLNWQSYALPWGPAPVYEFEMDGAAGKFIRDASGGDVLSALVILLAGLFRVMEKYSGRHDFFVDSPRLTTGGISDSCDSIPLFAVPSSDLTIREYLNRVREMVQDSYSFQDFPVGDFAAKRLGKKLTTNVHIHCDGLHEIAPSQHDLSIVIRPGDTFVISLNASPAVFTLHFLQHFARHFRNAVAEFCALDSPLDRLTLLDDEEKLRLLRQAEPIPADRTVLEYIAERVQAAPDSIAVATADGQITYGELDDRSSRLAHFLKSEYSIGRGDNVGILSNRSELWVIGLLGVLKAGAVYVPLDPDYPQERLRFMIEDADIRALLVHSDYLPLLTDFWSIPMFALDFQLDSLDATSSGQSPAAQPDPAAYIIYTSGSTGVPKGVVVRHRGLLNMALHHVEALGCDSTDRLIQFYSPSFDSSVFEVFVTLLAGARLVLAPPNLVKDVEQFSHYMASQGVTTISALPLYLSALHWDALGCVKRIVSAGDHARVEDARRLSRTRSFHNSYGPTEATVCVTEYEAHPSIEYGTRIPAGKPIRNVHIYLLDENRQLVPEGCMGEICISGVALAQGYLNRAELTAASFVENPFEPGERLYGTGDLGVWLPDGNLEVAGRRDSQVKIRGHRIEPGEIEAVLLQQNGVTDAAVLVREDPVRGRYLCAWIAPAQTGTSDLREFLKTRLPEHMIPAAFFAIDNMPITPNGKIDRKALATMTPESDVPVSPAAPENDMEERLLHIWSELLGRPGIGIHDNFFELGGDSIVIIQVLSRAQQAGIKLTAKQHFEHPTIAGLARVATDITGTRAAQGPVIGAAELTPAQHWFFSQPIEDRHHYNQSVMIEVPAELEPRVIEQALGAVIEHHDALRLAFFGADTPDGGTWEQIHAAQTKAVPFGVTSSGDDADILRIASVMQESFDLSVPPLLRANLFQSGPEVPSRLLLIVHHLVVDGVSWRILFEDLHTAARQIAAGLPVRLPEKTTPLRDWSRRLIELGATEFEGLEYWRTKAAQLHSSFAGAPCGTIASAASVVTEFDQRQTATLLQKAPRELDTEVDEILLTALLLAFRGWNSNPDLLVDLESHGREEIFGDVDLSRTFGWFTAIYPVLLKADAGASPADVLSCVKEQLRAVPMRGLGYCIARYLRRDPAVLAVKPAPVLFNYLGQVDRILPSGADWKPILRFNGPEQSPRDRRTHFFEVVGVVFDGRLRLTWTYNRDACAPNEIQSLAQQCQDNLLHWIENTETVAPSQLPAARIGSLSVEASAPWRNS